MTLTIPIEDLPSPALTELNADAFVNKQLASRILPCLDGADFERQLLVEKARPGAYAKVKLAGGAHRRDQDYAAAVLRAFGQPVVRRLLAICRFCSYLGGPGFPDLILPEQRAFRYTSDDLLPEQLLFILLAQAIGVTDVAIVRAVPPGTPAREPITISHRDLFASLSRTGRYAHYGADLENLLRTEQERLKTLTDPQEILQAKSEIRVLERQRYSMPFFLIDKWHLSGFDPTDLRDAIARLEALDEEAELEIQGIVAALKDDHAFGELGRGRDESTLFKKRDYLMETFSIGPSLAGEIVKMVA